ncbi:hypothetical protein ACGFNP_35020 [Nonomuraea sp. NPDC049269]|uniref:hypothetical protein n=1 Tax=Nonomuraea sp. NPDC049269 TaxID=3364349 RepID=UPI0037210C67
MGDPEHHPRTDQQNHQIRRGRRPALRRRAGDHGSRQQRPVHGTPGVHPLRFARWYPEGNWPAHSLAVVAALAAPELTVEIEGMAAVPRR